MTTDRIRVLAVAAALCAPGCASAAQEVAPPPGYLRMDGEWISRAVRAEPVELLDLPAFTQPHRISGTRNDAARAIFFTVRHQVDGRDAVAWLQHAYDPATNTTFGVLAPEEGGVLRVVTRHGPDGDVGTFYDASGAVVSTERSVWTSPDVWETEAEFVVDGEPARVWFVTRRVTSGEPQ